MSLCGFILFNIHAVFMSSLCGMYVRVYVSDFSSKNTRPRDMLFLSRVGHLGPTLDTVMGFFASFFMNFGRFEWKVIVVFGSF